MDLALNMEQFRYILENQSVWSEMYKKQQKDKRKENNQSHSNRIRKSYDSSCFFENLDRMIEIKVI